MAGCLALMVVMIFTNVALRYIFGSGLAASEELARLAFVWLIFIGAVLAQRDHGHLGVDMAVSRLPPRGRQICLLINHGVVLWVLWLLGSGSWTQTIIGLDSVTPVTGLPVATYNAAGVFVAVAMAVLIVADVRNILTGRQSGGDWDEARRSSDRGE
ncbi:MAG: TRAP transporter small permease subunit [Azospirillum sp.]|nr:TRAP transporter small permease subunit [Azospirillum sp.]